MSYTYLQIARNVSTKLAESQAQEKKKVWSFASGVAVFPEVRCPYCKQGVISKAIWKYTDFRLIGQFVPKAGQPPVLEHPWHPHARGFWNPPGNICWGTARDAHQALFSSINGKHDYVPYVIPWLEGPYFEHSCETIQKYTGLKYDRYGKTYRGNNVPTITTEPWAIVDVEEEAEEDPDAWFCEACGETYDDYTTHYEWRGLWYCEECFNKCAFTCYKCENTFAIDDGYDDPDGDRWCQDCFDAAWFRCVWCGDTFDRGEINPAPDGTDNEGDDFCSDCWRKSFFTCDGCRDGFSKDDLNRHEGDELCDDCYTKAVTKTCVVCDEEFNTTDEDEREEHTHLKCPDCEEYYYITEGEHTCGE